MEKKLIKFIFIIVFFIIFLLLLGFLRETNEFSESQKDVFLNELKVYSLGNLTVHFIDVGQGDATLFEGPNYNILIDAGRHDRNDVISYLDLIGIRDIRLLVGTHPHADHIGQFPEILADYNVFEVWMSGDEHSSINYKNTIEAIFNSNAEYNEPRAGDVVWIGQKKIEVLNPEKIRGDLHDGCISMRVIYGDVSFIFTGDAEAKTESRIIERGFYLKSDILQVGHHGSRVSSGADFLSKVLPDIAIYSAGLNNQFGHPHEEALLRLWAVGADIYGTDFCGTIKVITDGNKYEVIGSCEKGIKGFEKNKSE